MSEHKLDDYMSITERFFYNRYKLLGEGAYGKVYMGYDAKEKKFIAVKQICKANLGGI